MIQTELLNEIKDCRLKDTDGTIFTVVDVRFFNGIVSTIGLQSSDGVVKYAGMNRYMEMVDIA
jgi:hypothetical protein